MSLSDLKIPPPFKPRPELLLQNNTVKPLHEVTPRGVLGQGWWDRTRKAAYRSTCYRCAACGCTPDGPLEGHEVYEVDYLLGRQYYLETVPLCNPCHCFIHDGRLKALLDKGQVTREFYDKVMTHGTDVLQAAGLLRDRQAPDGPVARWEDWRLVVDGVEYPPKYRTAEEWQRAFRPEDET